MQRILILAGLLLALVLAGCSEQSVAPTTQASAQGFYYDEVAQTLFLDGKSIDPSDAAIWLISNQPSSQVVQELGKIPNSIQEQILKAGMIAMGVSSDTAAAVLKELSLLLGQKESSQATSAAACRQFIEYQPSAGATGCRGYWTDPYCDGDPSDNEYIFAYYPTWSDTPDDVRWYTYNAYVYYALWVAYRANLLARDACSPGVYLCIGDRGTWLAGGPVVVSLYVLVAHN
ncbi:MAG: hypothetical protein WCT08_04450 [Patescibacteria group bacterium]|jgi:hypothetical protein